MGVTVLREVEVPATKANDLWVDDSAGYRQAHLAGQGIIATDDADTHARASDYAMKGAPGPGKKVAWIGGGFCVGPGLFALTGCTQIIFEAQAEFSIYCPAGATFVAGDWRDTLTGEYDLIVYDLGGETPKDALANYLSTGGIILP